MTYKFYHTVYCAFTLMKYINVYFIFCVFVTVQAVELNLLFIVMSCDFFKYEMNKKLKTKLELGAKCLLALMLCIYFFGVSRNILNTPHFTRPYHNTLQFKYKEISADFERFYRNRSDHLNNWLITNTNS